MEPVMMNIALKNRMEDERPREKLLNKGIETLSNAELIGILLATGTRTKTAVEIGRELLHQAGNDMTSLARFGINDLKKVQGVGVAKALTLVAALELGNRRKLNDALKQKIQSSNQAFELLHPILAYKQYEEFRIIFLNRANNPISQKQVSHGGITGTVVDIRRVFKLALEENATSIILAHNHPSGNLNPSDADKALTRKLKAAGDIMDIPVRDHLIVTDDGYYSFADEGIL